MDKNVFNDLSYGMYVVSTKYKEKNVGCFVNTVTQITSQNPIIAVSINKNNYTNEALFEGQQFAISILSQKTNAKVIGEFGFFSSKNKDKFKEIAYKEINNLPVVEENICGYIIAQVLNKIDVETHNIVLARVLDAKKENENIPMTYSYYHQVIKGNAPKTAPTYIETEKTAKTGGKKYKCKICGYIYDEEKEKIKFEDLSNTWKCPLCKVEKDMFEEIKE